MDEPIAKNDKGEKVYLRDIWPSQQEVVEVMSASLSPEMFQSQYADVGNRNHGVECNPRHRW